MGTKIVGFVFLMMVLLQWYIPSKMILDREDILKNGTEFKFECQPIDPNDPFRGKYITLRFKESQFEVDSTWVNGNKEKIYVGLAKDSLDFVKISFVSKTKPSQMENVVKAKSRRFSFSKNTNTHKLRIEYPFDRFYMEESKAKPAEDLYRKSSRDKLKDTYALVMIKDGDAVLKDVMVDGVSIRELVKNQNK